MISPVVAARKFSHDVQGMFNCRADVFQICRGQMAYIAYYVPWLGLLPLQHQADACE
eukprot:CAMPEP_0172691948 /NCGR_PEP_ID=MMETSP1074-20121228/24894_1 /TAXON_ID=2916 /ORGANISM="Ceratium fusus, Strain PA161109" /LENGTH=56 /DNA_ID=CAMNT_0013512063 /DNA_START=320 /DNA_END=490 /DNA_ORIENTATION=+